MCDLVIIVALRSELPQSLQNTLHCPVFTLDDILLSSFSPPSFFILITGVGLERSKLAAETLSRYAPSMVVNIGTCGSMHSDFKVGDWVCITELSAEDRPVLSLHYPLPFFLKTSLKTGRLFSSQKSQYRPIVTDLVDMEAYAQAFVFEKSQTQFHVLKWVSDYKGETNRSHFKAILTQFHIAFESLLDAQFKFENPKISVIIPIYNRSRTIKRAIDSVLAQNYDDYELILVNDGSSDGLEQVLDRYKKDGRYPFQLIKLPDNKGVSFSRNRGIEQSTGDWIAFLDSDDEWIPEKLQNQVSFLKKNPFYRLLQSEEIWIRNGKRVNQCNHHAKPSGWGFELSLPRCVVSPSSVLIHRSLFEQHGFFDETLLACEDYDLWLRLLRYYPIGLESSQSLLKYGGHADQLSTKYEAMDSFRIYALEKALGSEQKPSFKDKITIMLQQKKHVYDSGKAKRKTSV